MRPPEPPLADDPAASASCDGLQIERQRRRQQRECHKLQTVALTSVPCRHTRGRGGGRERRGESGRGGEGRVGRKSGERER